MADPAPTGLTEADWDTLLRRIRDGECTPFVGAGACAGTIPVGSALADDWAKEFGYPLRDGRDLARVAQFLGVDRDALFPKALLRDQIRRLSPPDFDEPGEPHGVLADLKLPIYITTNYDGFMSEALRSRQANPELELCAWNEPVTEQRPSALDNGFKPSPATPVVYHLHGYYEVPQSMVLTEDDYLTFLVRLSKDNVERLLPSAIRMAFASTSLLFVGYSLADWDFRVLFRGLIGSLGRTVGAMSIAVQLEPETLDASPEGRERALKYLNAYFEAIQTIKVRVYWGDARNFGRELSQRWQDFSQRGD
jgi:SIR2-like domain